MIASAAACFVASLLFLLRPERSWRTPSTSHRRRFRASEVESGSMEVVEPQLIVRAAEASSPRQQRALDRAAGFATSLLKNLVDIPDSGGMRVMQQVYNPETGRIVDVVVRAMTEPFWQSCLDVVDTPMERIRLCVVGTSGIGKSLSIFLLIRMLLHRSSSCTVVYLLRTPDESSWYYEMQREGDVVHVAVYPEKTMTDDIESLTNRDSYYIIDPGNTKDDCQPPTDFRPRIILVSEPDECHWGESEFFKQRGDVSGQMMYYPVWTLEELLGARSILGPELSEQAVLDRYRILGGVLGFFFGADADVRRAGQFQDRAILVLTSEQAEQIAYGNLAGIIRRDQPISPLICLTPRVKDSPRFKFEVISSLVAEKIYFKWMGDLWNPMLSWRDPSCSWKIFEAYARKLIASDNPTEFEFRLCVGRDNVAYGCTLKVGFGGCCSNRIHLSSDIAVAAANTPNVVYYPVSDQHRLVDFIYREENGVFHAFQVTIGELHGARQTDIEALRQAVGPHQSLRLYYLVPAERFPYYVTDPVEPVPLAAMNDDMRLQVYHVMVPKPGRRGL